mgnify:CR=1 FL=1
MKIKEKFKKIIAGVGIFFTTITTKVFAIDINELLNNRVEDAYGITDPMEYSHTISYYILQVCKNIAIPLILVIGIIMLVLKRKNIKAKKIKIVIAIIVAIFLIVSIIAFILTLLNE